ncbi:MAG: DUF1553 domain-containing protein [Bacteroidetes bacterium]|nr:DUF1553 domain-containing protein [Bacteroidota bacterium]
MVQFSSKKIGVLFVLLLAVGALYKLALSNQKVDYNIHVKPIINKKCISCHGGVKQEAGFSLLFQEEALGPTESGKPAIIPGDPEASELIRRITEKDPAERMPYKHEALSEEEIEVFRQWIKEGAKWGQHWAYVSVKKQDIPDFKNSWIRNDIDKFIYEKLKEQKLEPAVEADKPTLLRRLSLDLIGLPALEAISKKYLQDNSEKAYENLVDDLLASPRYGERWTSVWLDLARYADTRGYEADRGRVIWKYRDWLIRAYNADKPYNDFLIEQLAGDLMPNPDDAKYIATAFHRNTMTNDEGGTDNEEFRTAAVMDRVNTTWSATMGTSFNCVQCHSHPYDPFKADEYYKFMAFFNNSRDEDTNADYPLLRQYNPQDSMKLVRLTAWLKNNSSAELAKKYVDFLKTWQPTINSLQCDQFVNAALISSWFAGLRNNGTCRLKDVVLQDKTQLMFRYKTNFDGGKWSIYLDALNGKLLKTIPLPNTKGAWEIVSVPIPSETGKRDLFFKYFSPAIKNPDDTGVQFEWFNFDVPFPGKGKPGYGIALKMFDELMHAKVDETPIMIENNQDQFRSTHIFERGNWMVKGNKVEPGVPAIMNPMPSNVPKNRLGMALWLTDKRNPLVARTMVNRVWEQLFGAGLAETLEDLGSQGIAPTHQELLDHLSWQFMNEFNWSMKRLLKEIVLSASYRQSSAVTEEKLRIDPNNKFYSRASRIRLSAEQLRDQALEVSNVLSKKMYGPSVMPFQPEGIWLSPYNGEKWKMSQGEDQYRRAVYTYLKRTAPYPSMMTFDGSSRESCLPRRIRTNTPLQALTSLNDSTTLVISRSLAFRMKILGGKESINQISKGYEAMMFKPITSKKLKALSDLYEEALKKYKKDKNAIVRLMGAKDKPADPETASLVVVAGALLNMDEWLNKN